MTDRRPCPACADAKEARAATASAPAAVARALRAPGRALDPATRERFGSRLGHDFADIRIHADESADLAARALGARAFAVGEHLVFGRGRFRPRTATGERLLAHELAHAASQRRIGSSPPPLRVGRADDAAERRADAAARAALCTGTRPCGEPPAGVEAEPAIIRRQVEPGASPSADLERAPAVPAIGPDWKVEEQLSIFFAQPRTDDRPDEARCEGDAWDETVRRMSRCGKARACRASKTGTFQFFVGYFVDIAAPGPAYPPELHGRRPRCRGTLRFTPDGGSARDVASWNERGSYRGPGRSILEKELSFESKSSGELAVELVVEHSSPDYTVTYDDVLRCEIVDCA